MHTRKADGHHYVIEDVWRAEYKPAESWLDAHQRSEQLAAQAGQAPLAKMAGLYRSAARLEAQALDFLADDQPRTYGITAVSAVALFMKAGDRQAASEIARHALGVPFLPDFAKTQIADMVGPEAR